MQQRSSNFDSTDKSLMEGNLERIMTGSLFQVVLMIAVATVQMGQTTEVTGNDDELWKTASEAGEKFSALYYRAFDKPNRPDLPGFFMDNVVLLWNGNRVEGQQLVVDFFSKLPDSTCTLHSLSCQPVHRAEFGIDYNDPPSLRLQAISRKVFSHVTYTVTEIGSNSE
ncbi:unnamed protein product [Schistosoma margrebowiei]|uniref:Uncharacterized protein n=1 Tax=Schistosoma margrebowiei TaxID=48269 RepID=A0A183M9T6_9TREM|nr:unnamed protein product [Schistosoma margrebowiei]